LAIDAFNDLLKKYGKRQSVEKASAGLTLLVDLTMRTRVRRFAHVLERIGLAMAGAASGLFVGIHVGSSIAALTSQGFLLIMMVSGAVGFYLGIDTPPAPFQPHDNEDTGSNVDSAEFLSAAGTFLATLAAFSSVGIIVLRQDPHIVWTGLILLGWTVGVLMQIVAGAIARFRGKAIGIRQ
jgi:hypothetical protein